MFFMADIHKGKLFIWEVVNLNQKIKYREQSDE